MSISFIFIYLLVLNIFIYTLVSIKQNYINYKLYYKMKSDDSIKCL